jgi:hypothetical protein
LYVGIRLFNRDQGRGGAGIDKMDSDAVKLSQTMVADLNKEVLFFSDACEKYQISILKAQLKRKRLETKEKVAEKTKSGKCYLSSSLSNYLSIYLSICLSIYLSNYLYVYYR